jgi:TetR/AcrR family transcriptional repressor of nem operon
MMFPETDISIIFEAEPFVLSRAFKKSEAVAALPTDDVGPFELAEHLSAGLAASGKLARSEATRRRLLIATAELVQELGFHDLKVADICKRAGFAHGTFYLYWKDRREAVEAVMTTFMQTIRTRRPPARPGQSFYTRLVNGHLYYIDVYRRNAGLMRCQGQLADQMSEFTTIGLEANQALARRVLRRVAEETGTEPETAGTANLATALACIAMVDRMLYEIFVRKLNLGMDDAALARMMSAIWYRALLPGRPLDETAP